MLNILSVGIKCKGCNEMTEVGVNNLKKSMMTTINGECVWMTYFDCPKCGLRNFVQADSEATNKLLEAETKLIIMAIKKKKLGKAISQKQSEKRKRIEADLAESRNNLNRYLSGMMVTDCETKLSYVVRFCDIANIQPDTVSISKVN